MELWGDAAFSEKFEQKEQARKDWKWSVVLVSAD